LACIYSPSIPSPIPTAPKSTLFPYTTLFRSKLMEENYISFENYFLDGTKIEADANRYTFVWKKSTLNYEEKLKKKIEETLEHIQDRKSTRLNSSHVSISYAVFCLKKKRNKKK